VACRATRPKKELIRIVRTPGGAIEADATGRKAGRGAYLCADRACWEAALAKGSVARALAVSAGPELRAVLEAGPAGATMTTNETTTTMLTTGGDERGEE
jgi:predicted RNA-binding protein YlxR (DUF448 family)